MIPVKHKTCDTTIAFLCLGSNLGKRLANLRAAVDALAANPAIAVDRNFGVSSVYETDPIGGPPGQPDFLNAVIRIDTSLTPRELLEVTRSIEKALGREREVHHGPRTIDIDILLYGTQFIDMPDLQIPHTRLHQRRFVLEPLCELAPDAVHPLLNLTVRKMAQQATDINGRIARIAGSTWCR